MEYEQIVSKVKDALAKSNVVLVILPAESYRDITLSLMDKICNTKVCYLTCNKSSKAIMEEMKQYGINSAEFFFLDCVSKQAGLYDGSREHMFLESPTDLDELFSVSTLALKKKFNYFIVDSLNSLFSHNIEKQADAVNFAEKVANRARDSKTKLLFLALGIPTQRSFIDEAAVFADSVIDFSKS